MMFWEIEETKGLQIRDFVLKDEKFERSPVYCFQNSAIRSLLSLGIKNQLNITMSRLSPAHGPKFSRNQTHRRLTGRQQH